MPIDPGAPRPSRGAAAQLGAGARHILVIALVVLAGGCVKYSGAARPIAPETVTAETGWISAAPTPVVRQHGAVDCGPAALAMVAGRWGVELSLEEAIAALPAPSAKGSSVAELRTTARARGLDAYAIEGDLATLEYELRAGRPILVGLLRPHGRQLQSHFEVVVALRPSSAEVVTIDPGVGWRVRKWTELDAEWKPAGRPALVVLGPAAIGSAD